MSELSVDSLAAIDHEIAKYPKGKQASAVMSALRIAQKERGWLAKETIEFVANYLSIPAIRAYEVATFYNMYDLKPTGKRKLCLCTNLPCALMGAMKTAKALKKRWAWILAKPPKITSGHLKKANALALAETHR